MIIQKTTREQVYIYNHAWAFSKTGPLYKNDLGPIPVNRMGCTQNDLDHIEDQENYTFAMGPFSSDKLKLTDFSHFFLKNIKEWRQYTSSTDPLIDHVIFSVFHLHHIGSHENNKDLGNSSSLVLIFRNTIDLPTTHWSPFKRNQEPNSQSS